MGKEEIQEWTELNRETLRRADDVEERGLVVVWLRLGLGFAENVVRVSHAVAQGIRREGTARGADALGLAEGLVASGFRTTRALLEASDVLTRDAFARVERATLSGIATLDRAGDDPREGSRAVGHVAGGAPTEAHAS